MSAVTGRGGQRWQNDDCTVFGVHYSYHPSWFLAMVEVDLGTQRDF